MDSVIRKTGFSSDPDNISRLILGVVVFKGGYNLPLRRGERREGALQDPARAATLTSCIQQVCGDTKPVGGANDCTIATDKSSMIKALDHSIICHCGGIRALIIRCIQYPTVKLQGNGANVSVFLCLGPWEGKIHYSCPGGRPKLGGLLYPLACSRLTG